MFYFSFTHNTDLGGDFRTTTMQEGQWQGKLQVAMRRTMAREVASSDEKDDVAS
jgi:hypothetical protein